MNDKIKEHLRGSTITVTVAVMIIIGLIVWFVRRPPNTIKVLETEIEIKMME